MSDNKERPYDTKNKEIDIVKMSYLSRISVSSEQYEKMRKDLRSIKEMIDRVKNSEVKSDSRPFDVLRYERDNLKDRLKPHSALDPNSKDIDQPRLGLPLDESEKLAPSFSSGHFVIPSVLPKKD